MSKEPVSNNDKSALLPGHRRRYYQSRRDRTIEMIERLRSFQTVSKGLGQDGSIQSLLDHFYAKLIENVKEEGDETAREVVQQLKSIKAWESLDGQADPKNFSIEV